MMKLTIEEAMWLLNNRFDNANIGDLDDALALKEAAKVFYELSKEYLSSLEDE